MNPVDEFCKEAGWLDSLGHGLFLGAPREADSIIANRVGQTATRVAITAGLLAAAKGIIDGAGKIKDKYKASIDRPIQFQAMMKAHPTLAEHDPEKVNLVFNSIRHFSPALAADPLASGSIVRNVLAVYGQENPMIAPETAKHLTEIQRNVSGGEKKPLLGDLEKHVNILPSYMSGSKED